MFFGFSKKKREKTYPVSHAAFNYSITPVSHRSPTSNILLLRTVCDEHL